MIFFKKIKGKVICQLNRIFLIRLTYYLKLGSLKLHIILKDDIGEPHTHPWDFKSFILFGGYYEELYKNVYIGNADQINSSSQVSIAKTDELIKWSEQKYPMFSINRKDMNTYHKIKLRRFFGIPIPCITIGIYSEKKQLCSLCEPHGYCLQNKNK